MRDAVVDVERSAVVGDGVICRRTVQKDFGCPQRWYRPRHRPRQCIVRDRQVIVGHRRKVICRTAAEKDKSSAAALLALGDLYKAENDEAKARAAYQEALVRDPQNAAAKAAVGEK